MVCLGRPVSHAAWQPARFIQAVSPGKQIIRATGEGGNAGWVRVERADAVVYSVAGGGERETALALFG